MGDEEKIFRWRMKKLFLIYVNKLNLIKTCVIIFYEILSAPP